jgi:excisionase family DNA binding protein
VNTAVNALYAEYLEHTGGDKAAAASLALAAVLVENGGNAQPATGPANDDPYSLTVDQAAEHLGISASKVYKMCSAGELCCFKVGRSLRISRDALDAFEREATEAARPWQPPIKMSRRLR